MDEDMIKKVVDIAHDTKKLQKMLLSLQVKI